MTQIKLPSDDVWMSGTCQDRWMAVSTALKNGRTSISRKGSLAYITADGFEVGGTYTLTLYQDNRSVTVWSTSAALTAGTLYTWSKAYAYPGSSHYYWLYVSGPDYCYTTPIYVHP